MTDEIGNCDDTLEQVDGEPLVALVRPSADFSDALDGLDPELVALIDAMALRGRGAGAEHDEGIRV